MALAQKIQLDDKMPARSLYKKSAEEERLRWLEKRNDIELDALSKHVIC